MHKHAVSNFRIIRKTHWMKCIGQFFEYLLLTWDSSSFYLCLTFKDEKHFSVDSKDVEKRAAVKYNINSSPVNNKVDRKTVVNDLEKLFSKSTGSV